MIARVQEVVNLLLKIHDRILELGTGLIDSNGENYDILLCDEYGDHLPALTTKDLAMMPKALADLLVNSKISDLDDDDDAIMIEVVHRLGKLSKKIIDDDLFKKLEKHQVGFVPFSYPHKVFAFISTIKGVETMVHQVVGWRHLSDNNLIPKKIINRLNTYHARLGEIEPNFDALNEKIKVIEAGYSTVESWPNTLEELRNSITTAETKVKEAQDEAAKSKVEAVRSKSEADRSKSSADGAEQDKQRLESLLKKAEELVEKADHALRGSTNVSLANAFDKQAKNLRNGNYVWLLALVGSLIAILCVSIQRAVSIQNLINEHASSGIPFSILWVQTLMSLLVVAAPAWLAWVATKQIKQRFKLQQDYNFKAASAQSYEGFRLQAINYGDGFEEQLFKIAMQRLAEHPERFFEKESDGSPVSEFIRNLRSPSKKEGEEAKLKEELSKDNKNSEPMDEE